MNQFLLGPWVSHKDHFIFFSKIHGDILEWMFINRVNNIGDKTEKFWGIIFFSFVKSLDKSTLF